MDITPLESWISRKLSMSGWPSIAKLREYQLAKFRETLEHVVAHSRFYREYLKGLDPASIGSMQDVAGLPLTDPGMLAERTNDFWCVSPREISRLVTLSTSGTTGRPKRIAFTPEDQELTVDFFHHGMTTLGEGTDRVVIFLPGESEGSVGDLLRRGLSRFGCEGFVYGPVVDYGHALRALLELKASSAVGIPSQILALSRHSQAGLSAEQVQLKTVLLSTDYVPLAIADSLARTWGCKVYGHYGMTEMGLGGGVECSARDGYHLREADLLFEIIDPGSGGPVEDGQYGEVVFSTLTRTGMPLIRYRTGDRSRFLTQPCPCGSVLRRMERISGRIREAVRLKEGSSISIAQLDEVLFGHPRVSAYAAEICSTDGCDCLVLTVRSAQHAVNVEQIANELRRHCPIGEVVERGDLKLEVREGNVEYSTTGTAKRSIVDRRK